MRQPGIHQYEVTGDHVALYKEALLAQGQKAATALFRSSVYLQSLRTPTETSSVRLQRYNFEILLVSVPKFVAFW
jgi:hypothetical protein